MKKKIFLKGPLLTRSGYGEQSRFALRSLRSREDLFEIFIQPLQWGKTSWTPEMDEERIWIDQAIEKTIAYIQQGGKFDISLQVTIPNEFENHAPINIGYTAGIETTKAAHQWIQKINEMDRIITTSSHSKKVLEETQYHAQNTQTGQQFILKAETPIEFVNYPVKTYNNIPELELNVSTSFNFLAVAQFGPRKNLLNTIKWFIEEFRDEDVGLVVKSNISKNCLMDRSRLNAELTNFLRQQGERQCKVYLLHGDLTDAEMHSLYRNPQINAFVSLPHGEGFGLPIFEAAYSGLPVVATGWSGQLDFLIDAEGREEFYNVAFDLQPVQPEVVWDGVLVKDSMWAFPREGSAKGQMRKCYENMTDSDLSGVEMINLERITKNLQERFSEQGQYQKFVSLFDEYEATQDSDDWLREVADIVKEYE
jgi:glycosyltransferase involved in cell wall biosynthesis